MPEDPPDSATSVPTEEVRSKRFARVEAPAASSRQRSYWALVGLALYVFCLFSVLSGVWPAWLGPSSRDDQGVRRDFAVVIDPGHGGGDTGAVAQGVVEKDLNLDVGRRVAQSLRGHGISVRMTREDDRFIPLEERVRVANSQAGAVFVSIHFNDASGDGRVAMNRASGIETYYSVNKAMSASPGGWMWASLFGGGAHADPGTTRNVQAWSVQESMTLAQSIQGSIVGDTAATDRGIKQGGLYVTRRVRGPAVLVEGGFVSHPAEARLLANTAYRQKLAEAIADGILKYLRIATQCPAPQTLAATSTGV